jgi:hypothetical protein
MSYGQQPARRLLVLEFNELCPAFIEHFMAAGLLPNFRRLRDQATAYITHTDEAVLEPWIQWVTLHTGVPLEQHGIMDLDEAGKLHHPTFWDAMQADNVLLMAPMNVKFERRDDSIFMPDPWAAAEQPSVEIQPLYRFIRSVVQTHMRADGLSARDSLAAIQFLVRHGLKLKTATAAVRQVWHERRSHGIVKWRRAALLDRLLWDVFAHYWQSPRRPKVGIFFSNSTAHYQHKYWRYHDPEAFTLKPSAQELAWYQQVIRFGYQAHDRLLGKALAMADNDTAIALCTALSQQPMHDYESRGGKAMFIPKDFATLLAALGISTSARAEQIMAEETRLHFERPESAARALEVIESAVTSEGHALFKVRGFDGHSFIVGCAVFVSEVTPHTTCVAKQGMPLAFADHFIPMPTVTSGKHHPDGVFWLARAQQAPSIHSEPLPLTEVRGKLEAVLGLPAFNYRASGLPADTVSSPHLAEA